MKISADFQRFAHWICVLCLLPLSTGFAQSPCGTDYLHSGLFSKNADYRATHDTLERHIFRKTLRQAQGVAGAEFSPLPAAPLLLPVVVHIVHQGGPENLSNAQVQAALTHLNAAFAHTGYFAQQGVGTDALIQFCLARRTPDGLPTEGITRTASPLTDMILETQDLSLKNLSRWPSKQYINIWVVRSISSTAVGASVGGYAFLPAAHGLTYDGIVVEAAGLGDAPAEVADLAHEMGHYLGLYHTFEGGCLNANCLTDGDRVCDTPPDRATNAACPFNSCATDADDASPNNPLTADVADAGWNFMDYSPQTCYSGFSTGQGLRMRLAVEGARKSLLASKGCAEPCPAPVTAAFALADSSVVAGTALIFSNLSVGATQFSWYDGGALFSSSAAPAPYTPPATGIRTLRLVVSNGNPNCTDTTELLVAVACNITAAVVATDTVLDVGQSVTFTALTSGATAWAWTVDGVATSSAVAFSRVFTQNGDVTVGLTASNAFCSIAATLTLQVGDGPCKNYLYREYDRSLPDNSGLSRLRPRFLEPTNDGGYLILGYALGKGATVTKCAPNGDQQWQRTYTSLTIISTALNTPDGGYLLTGHLSSTLDEGFLLKCDATGQVLWAKRWNDLNTGNVLTAVCQAGGYFFMVQRLVPGVQVQWQVMRTDADGNVLWTRSRTDGWLVSEIQGTADGGLLLAKSNMLLKLDASGTLIFAKNYTLVNSPSTHLFVQAKRRMLDTDGNDAYLMSQFEGYVWKTDAAGEVLWAKKLLNYNKMAVLPGGEGVVVGKDNQLGKLSAADGSLLWARGISQNFPVFGAECHLRRMEGASVGQFVHTSRQPGTWSPLRFFVAATDDGDRTTCVGGAEALTFPAAANIAAQPDTLTFSPYAPDWLPLNASTQADTTRFVVKKFCSEKNCPEVCDNGRDDDGDNYVDCYDSDCPCDKISLGCHDRTVLGDIKGRVAWTTNSDQVSVIGVPLVGNLNPLTDSLTEIIVPTATSSINGLGSRFLIFRGDGSNANSPDQVIVPGSFLNYPMAHPTIADLNNDGRPELIAMNAEGFVYVFTDYKPGTNPPMKIWAISDKNSQYNGLRLYPADFDHDGISELYSGDKAFWLDFSAPFGPLLRSNLVAGSQNLHGVLVTENTTFPVNSSLVADFIDDPADCEPCPGMEIAAGSAIFQVKKQAGGGFDVSLSIQQSNSSEFGYASIANVLPNGALQTIRSGSSAPTSIVDVDIAGINFLSLGNSPYSKVALICIANIHDDRTQNYAQDLPEILIGHRGTLHCLSTQPPSTSANAWWQIPIHHSGNLAVTAFDFNGDGYDEVVLHDSTHLRVLYGGPVPFPPGVDSERNWFTINAPSLPLDNYPVIADVDGDLEAEIVYTTYASPDDVKSPDDRRGRLVVVESDGGTWYPARPVWNQFSYLPVAIHDDLRVPAQQQPHQMALPPGSDQRPLNKCHAQLPLLDSLYQPYRPLFDFSLRSDSSRCFAAGDSVRTWLTLCNSGEKPLLDSLPIAVYIGDPTAAAAPLLRTLHLVGRLRKGQCRSFSLDLPAAFGQPIYVVANDDGTQPRPFSVTANFPARRGKECGYAENIASFTAFYVEKTFSLGPDLVRCGSSTLTLSAGSGYADYRWQDGSTDSTFTAYASGKYWVETRDHCGTTYADTLLITLDSIAGLTLTADTLICLGDSLRLSAGGAVFDQIGWSPALSLSCSNCADPLSKPTISTTYTLTVKRGECVVTDTVRVAVHTLALQLVGQNPTCDTPGSLAADIAGAGPFKYRWSDGSSGPALTGLAPGTYALTLTSATGCVQADTLALWRVAPTGADLNTDSVTCYGLSDGRIRVGPVAGGQPPFEYSLDGQFFQTDSVFALLAAGIYTATVRDANGCTTTAANGATVNQPPVFQVTLTGSSSVIPGLDFPLTAAVQPATAALQQIRWEPSALFPLPDNLQQTLSIQQPTLVSVTVTDWHDCSASDTLAVGLDKTRFVFFPNVIAPEGTGLAGNERFTAYGSEAVQQLRWLRVFDRWGNLVFERTNFAPNDPALGWDGRFQDKKMPPGVYVWAAEVEFTDGERQRMDGEVAVVR